MNKIAKVAAPTPGMILATYHLREKYLQPTMARIQEGRAGNLCRCAGYKCIFNAVEFCATKSHA